MRILLTALILLHFTFPFFAQTQLSGIINTYTPVLEIDDCTSAILVADASNFNSGDHVLLIQMKGATMDESNASSFGNILDLGSAGLFEKASINHISEDTIFLHHFLVNVYDVSGFVQLINFPKYDNATVVNELTAQAWNGETGGVLVFEVENNLILEAPISVTGQGFRGAEKNVVTSNCTFLTNANDYHYDLNNWRSSPKGEGIVEIIHGKEAGRGAQANGGGGGNDHNSGGGGGANVAKGGIGGKHSVGGFGCNGEYAGRGGKVAPNTTGRLFLGGGGGAGHTDNGVGTSGSHGGGLILLIVNSIQTNGHNIQANGNATPNGSDGAGGGGAGGTIWLHIENTVDNLVVEANGGDGGSTSNSSDRCYGPGGGGSGGHLLTNIGSITNLSLLGGQAGVNLNTSSQCSDDPSNGAEAGQHGNQVALPILPQGIVEVFPVMITQQPESMEVCTGEVVAFELQATGSFFDYQWQMNAGNGFEDLPNTPPFVGANEAILTISNVPTSFNDNTFRCIITAECGEDDLTSAVVSLTVLNLPEANFTFNVLPDGMVEFFNLSTNATTFEWDFGDTQTSQTFEPIHQYTDIGQFTISLTAMNACDTVVTMQTIFLDTEPIAGFSPNITNECAPLTVQFLNQSSSNSESFEWQFPGGDPAISTALNPTVTYPEAGSYSVTLIAFNSAGQDTLTQVDLITAEGIPQADFQALEGGLEVIFQNASINANTYSWAFGDGNFSLEPDPVHTYLEAGIFDVTLTVTNDCGADSLVQQVLTAELPTAFFNANMVIGCAPMIVQFNDLSSGTDLNTWQWQFPGGVPATSEEQHPQVSYPTAGVYDVSLTVTSDFGASTFTQPNFITVEAFPEANFTFDTDSLTVSFTNTSIGGQEYLWDFGDLQFSQEENPTHSYAEPGLYEVTLTVSSVSCASSVSLEVLVMPVSTKEIENATSFKIYPNPTQDLVHIEWKHSIETTINWELLDVNGRVLNGGFFSKKPIEEIDLKALPKGVYLLKMNKDGWESCTKLVKW